jgi:hypothetical protein
MSVCYKIFGGSILSWARDIVLGLGDSLDDLVGTPDKSSDGADDPLQDDVHRGVEDARVAFCI